MKTLLLVHHSPSTNLAKLVEACERGFHAAATEHCQFTQKAAFAAQPEDLQQAQAVILLTPENLAYMSGALKDFFDRCYYPCLEHTQGLPCAAIIRAGQGGGEGTQRALASITTGLKWRWVQEPLILRGQWLESFELQAFELSQAMASALDSGII